MRTECKRKFIRQRGSALVLVISCMVILIILGIGMLTVAYGVRLNAIMTANRAIAMLTAEAGYEKAVFWLSKQSDVAYVMKSGGTYSDFLNSTNSSFTNSSCNYSVSFFSFLGSRPAYEITSIGKCGMFSKTVDVIVLQQIGGWDMGMCRIPNGGSSTQEVYFADNEIIDMPLHINKYNDNPDVRDIWIRGTPQFLQDVAMGESRYDAGNSDKYAGVMNLFQGVHGIDFDQPASKITDESTVLVKVNRFKDSTKNTYNFQPIASAPISSPQPAVQLEFFVNNGVGQVRITNNCTVRGYTSSSYCDYKITPNTNGTQYQTYPIYAYHLRSNSTPINTYNITDTYVTQSIGGIKSEPGGQIFVNGNVIIGGDGNGAQIVQGQITVVATGNIWVADSIVLDGTHDTDAEGKPSGTNPNALGLIAQGVVRVVDPGVRDNYDLSSTSNVPNNFQYVPIGITQAGGTNRYLPDPTIVEAAITVGGGGWGAENVGGAAVYPGYGRKEYSGPQDNLIVRGAITEAIRAAVGQIDIYGNGIEGYSKHYYFDSRLLKGILPGDIWLSGKYTPAPAGWHDYSSN